MREWDYTKGYSVGGLIFQLGDPVEGNERLTDFAFATTTVQRERVCDFYKVSDLVFTLSDAESGKELEVWGTGNITYKDIITEGLYTEELYTGIHTADRFFKETLGVMMDWERVCLFNRTHTYAVQIKGTVSFGVIAGYSEELAIKSKYIPTWLISRLYDETIEIDEQETNSWTISRIFTEITIFFDAVLQKIIGFFTDETSMHERAPAWQINRNHSEKTELTDYLGKGIKTRTAEAVILGDEVKRETNAILYDGVAISDALRNNVLSWQTEFIYPKEKESSVVEGGYSEQVKITDTIKNQWRTYRNYSETINTFEKPCLCYKDNVTEAISVKEVRIRPTTNGILSNVIISEKEMTYEDFQKNADQIAGYAPFVEFKVGDYEYKTAVYRMVLSRTNINSAPLFYGYEVHVDIPDTIDRGECAVNGETKVYFNKHYYHAPEINVTTTGGTEVLIPRIVSIDNEDGAGRYFIVILENLSGESKSGRISWSARGY